MGSIRPEWIHFASQIKWSFAIGLLALHIGAIYGFYLAMVSAKWQTIVVYYILSVLAGIGVLSGAHRFFSHRSFKAKWQLRVILCVLQTLSGQLTIIDWALDHHTHHKYEGTNADAVSIGRGFFFAHIGWLMMERHPECEEKRSKIDVNYLWSDPIVKFQYDYYIPLVTLINCIIPTFIPYLLFGETVKNGFFICFCMRFVYTMQLALSGNSFAHIFGYREYDKSFSSTYNKPLNYLTLGGAYHNYHHVYPYGQLTDLSDDYSASEFGWQSNFNIYTAFIELFSWKRIQWAYDLKKAPQELIDQRRKRTGQIIPTNPYFKKYPIIDWILGLILSVSLVWIIILYRIFNFHSEELNI